VLRAAGETVTTQGNIQDWLQLDEEDPEFQLLVFLYSLNKGSTEIFLFIFVSTTYIIKFPIYFFPFFFFAFYRTIFCFINPFDLSLQLKQISEGLL
jgi:hypothetical protein